MSKSNTDTGVDLTITLNANGGESTGDSDNKLYSNKYTTYTSNGWTTTSGSTTRNYANGASTGALSGNLTLYPCFSQGTSYDSVTLPTPSRNGYTFNGWYTASSGGTRVGGAGASYTPDTTRTLYAQWSVNSYTVTIAGTNVTKGANSISVAYGSSGTVTITPSSGYYLSGASCTNGYTTNATTGTSATGAQTVTIYNNSKASTSTCTFTGAILSSTLTNYIFDGRNKPTTSSPTTPPSGKKVYLGLYADGKIGVCIKRNGTQHCFKYQNWNVEKTHIQNVFSDISCSVDSSRVSCTDYSADEYCLVHSNGFVSCRDNGARERCDVNSSGSVYCY